MLTYNIQLGPFHLGLISAALSSLVFAGAAGNRAYVSVSLEPFSLEWPKDDYVGLRKKMVRLCKCTLLLLDKATINKSLILQFYNNWTSLFEAILSVHKNFLKEPPEWAGKKHPTLFMSRRRQGCAGTEVSITKILSHKSFWSSVWLAVTIVNKYGGRCRSKRAIICVIFCTLFAL